ncbi:hypothetical protein [Anaeromyxobacter oryzae]|uniref:Uncharacterized protein n=1 Tax=Anaeromyxobacter oryzae TaxID=2918170 RepID=A0ABN6MSG2_9BACT|nr:hypothetical protein [Anaeromyxobacter oryzae]BDG03923.1 hypothetical protein AMOR_29190 [Anaeromyxobacter oryzae]
MSAPGVERREDAAPPEPEWALAPAPPPARPRHMSLGTALRCLAGVVLAVLVALPVAVAVALAFAAAALWTGVRALVRRWR